MDLTYFIQNKSKIEVAEKVGLYCVSQSHIPAQYQAYRCGLAGKNVEDPAFRSTESNFSGRMGRYLSAGWLPTDGKIWACITVPRVKIAGYSERVVDPSSTKEGSRRMDDATTLIQLQERRYHALLLRYGMKRLGMPGTVESRKLGEFFRGPLQIAIKALKGIGQGDFYQFDGNNINKIKKQILNKGDVIETEQIPLRKSERFTINEETAEALQNDDPGTKRAIDRLAGVQPRKSPRLAGEAPIVFEMSRKDLDALSRGDERAKKAAKALQQVRRSPRLNN